MTEHRVKVDNGKYEFVRREDGEIRILRHGEPWIEWVKGDNAIHAAMAELDAARAVLQAARQWQAALSGSTQDHASADQWLNEALHRHDALTGDREPPSAWCGAVQSEPEPGWIPPSQRVPDPGPCTPMAHHWASGSAVCRCGEATRNGDCRFWYVASRLTGAQIYEVVTGQPKPTAPPDDCSCAGGDHGGHDLDCERKEH